ncbi:MAG TPA: DUF2752 domain-containing protein [Candidatus Binatia bacterium]|jgi:hypothetical protein|nr:DUF2752 domain-containing protein [Candidatus Binatia bacterium]
MAGSTRSLLRAGVAVFGVAAVGHALGAWDVAAVLPRLPALCPVHALTGHDCPGCGMTRSLALLAQGHVGASLHQHPFGLPVALWAVTAAFLPASVQPVRSDTVRIGAVVALLGWWAVRAFV